MKPNCYKCVYRRNVPGSAHSRCVHPAFSDVTGSPFLQIVGIFASVGRVPPIQIKTAVRLISTLYGWNHVQGIKRKMENLIARSSVENESTCK